MRAGGHNEKHVPPSQLNGVPPRLPRLPHSRPRLHLELINPQSHRKHCWRPNSTHLDCTPSPLSAALDLAAEFGVLGLLRVDQVVLVRKGAIARAGLWSWGAA